LKRKWLGFLLTIILVFTFLPVYAFASGNYNIAVSTSANQVTVTGGNPSYAGQTITLRVVDSFSRNILVDEKQAQSNGNYSFGPYTLENGSYTAYVGGVVTAESNAFTVSSTVPSTNAYLQSLQVSRGTLDFNRTTSDYTVSVGNSVSILTVTAVPEESHASVTINTVAGSSKDIPLNEGDNPVTVEVTAQDGTTKRTYDLVIKRAAAQTANSTTPITVSSDPVTITVPAGVTNAKVAVTTVPVGSSLEATLPLVEVQAATSLGNVSVTIPAGTKITAPAGWDGTIKLPEVQSNSSVSVSNGNVSAVIEVGSPDVSLTFDKAVRLLIPNQGGKSAGYERNGVFTPITGTITEDTQTAADSQIAAGGDAKITVGSDLVIWTKHFTKFASYTEITPPPTSVIGGLVPVNSGTIVAGSGGTLTLNGAKIDVPAAAINSNITVTVDKVSGISKLPVDKALKLLGDVYEIKKDKDGEFSKPVVITLPFDKTKVDFNKSTLGVYWLNEQTQKWVQLDDLRVDQVNGTVSGSVKHFTKFAVLSSDKPEKPQDQTTEVNFTDIKGHWAEANIRELVKQGAINGYPDNTFKPNGNITRAEFITVIVNAFNLKSQEGKSFTDTSTHWAKSAISTAAALGVVTGYNENTFGPNDLITREQMASIVIRAAKIDLADNSISFSDSSNVSDWARTALATASAKGLINGYADGTVKPKANTTRAEAVTVILKALQLKK
jgi:hypothetical protein